MNNIICTQLNTIDRLFYEELTAYSVKWLITDRFLRFASIFTSKQCMPRSTFFVGINITNNGLLKYERL